MSKENEIEKELKEKKKKTGIAKVFSIIVDVLIVPVIILAFACTILTFSAKANNQVPSIFGMSIVTVLSDSMEPEHKVNDVLIIKQIDTEKLKVGDKIAFYAAKNGHWAVKVDGEYQSAVIFHQIVRILEIDGKPYFACMGTNVGTFNNKKDSNFTFVGEGNGDYAKNEQTGEYYIKEGGAYWVNLIGYNEPPSMGDINAEKVDDDTMQIVSATDVVGIYDSGLSPVLGAFINFSSSSTGMLCLVIIPSVILIALTIFSLTKEIKQAKEEDEKERKVLEGNISKLKETSSKAKEELEGDKINREVVIKETPKEEQKVDIHQVISNVAEKNTEVAETKGETVDENKQSDKVETNKTEVILKNVEEPVKEQKEEQPVKEEKSKKQPKKVAPKKEEVAGESVEDKEQKVEEKPSEVKAEAPKKATPKKVAPIKVKEEQAEAEPKVEEKEAKAPKKAPAPKKVAPKKVAPVKAKEEQTEVEPKEEKETKVPKKAPAPKKVAPKKVEAPKND